MPIKIRTRVSVGDAAIEDFHAFLEDYPYPEAEKVEVMAGEYFDDWVEHVDAGSARANRILALLVLRQENPELQLKDVTVGVRKIKKMGYSYCEQCQQDQVVRIRPMRDDKGETLVGLDGAPVREYFCEVCRHIHKNEPENQIGLPPTEAPPEEPSESAENRTPASSHTSSTSRRASSNA